MNDIMLVYFRMVSYFAVILIGIIAETRHCSKTLYRGNVFLAVCMLATLIVTRFIAYQHSSYVATALTTVGFIVWAIYHFADFIMNGGTNGKK